MTPLVQTLITAGFEPSVAAIYVALVENGEQQAPQIMAKTGLSRAGVYDALAVLISQNYVEYRKDGRNAYYKAVHPEKLRDLVAQKKREVVLLEGEMGETIKTLIGEYNLTQNKPGVRFFEGVDGLKEMYRDTLIKGGPIFALLSPAEIPSDLKLWLDKEYVPERVAKKIEAHVIAPSSKETESYTKKDDAALRDTVTISSNDYPIEIEINVYGKSSVAFISFPEQIGFILDSPAVAMSMRTFFSLAWKGASGKSFHATPPPEMQASREQAQKLLPPPPTLRPGQASSEAHNTDSHLPSHS